MSTDRRLGAYQVWAPNPTEPPSQGWPLVGTGCVLVPYYGAVEREWGLSLDEVDGDVYAAIWGMLDFDTARAFEEACIWIEWFEQGIPS